MKQYFKKIAPEREKLEQIKLLRPIAHRLTNPKIWHFNRRAVAAGFAIGMFFGSLPIAGQMPLSAVLAIFFRANMPVAVLSTWFSNPFTMPFIFTGNYYFGAWLLGSPTVNLSNVDWSFDALLQLGGGIVVPLFFGSIVVGVILAIISLVTVRMMWRFSIVKSRGEQKRKRTHGKGK